MTMMRANRISRRPFAVLDVGTSKICCMIARRNRAGDLLVLGQGTRVSEGIRAGEVVSMKGLSDSVGHCVQECERAAGHSIDAVSVVLPGGRPHSTLRRQSMALADGIVTRRDIRRILDKAGAQEGDPAQQVMQFQPICYGLDETRAIAEPSGMRGRELSVEFLTVSASRTLLANVIEALALNHLGVERFIHAGYAAGLAVLDHEQRELGSTVIDLGAGTSSLAMFIGGNLIYVDTLAVGGRHVTNDIARILASRPEEAERIKAMHGSITPADDLAARGVGAAPSRVRHAVKLGMSDNIAIPGVDDVITVAGKTLERTLLNAIIRPRVEEIFEIIVKRMRGADMEYAAGNRLFLTGGASQLAGIADFCARTTGRVVELAAPAPVANLTSQEAERASAAVIGGVLHISRLAEDDPGERQTRPVAHGPITRIGGWFRDNL